MTQLLGRRCCYSRGGPHSQAGVTLIELLIAVSLMSLLTVGIVYAMRLAINSQERANKKMMANRRVTGAQRILEQQVANLVPVMADCRATPVSPPSPVSFFQGEPQAMRFVSTYSLEEAHRGYSQILEYSVIAGENNMGFRLLVNELLYSGARSTGALCLGNSFDQALGVSRTLFRPIESGPRSFVLADKLASIRFLFREQLPAGNPQLVRDRWVPLWTKPELPTGIRIEMMPLEASPGTLHVMTVTAPVRITIDPMRKQIE